MTLYLAETLYAWLRAAADACRVAVDEGLALARTTGCLAWTPQLGSLGVASALSSGDLPRARRLLEAMGHDFPMGGHFARANYHFYVGWEAFQRGDFPLAVSSAQLALAGAEECDFPYARAYGRIACALALREVGRRAEARTCIDEAGALSETIGSDLVRYSYLLTAADIALRNADEPHGLAHLATGLRLGRERDISNMFWLLPSVAERLTVRALEEQLEGSGPGLIIGSAAGCCPGPRPPSCGADWALRVRAACQSGGPRRDAAGRMLAVLGNVGGWR
jgi:tetratricopeptide (TPR) repeat protein